MKKNNIFIGNINIVENGKVKLYQATSLLLSLDDGTYVNLEWINSIKDRFNFYKGRLTGRYSEYLTIDNMRSKDGIYVDRKTLVPYYSPYDEKQIGLRKVIREFICDSRIPYGYEEVCGPHGTAIIYVRKSNPKCNNKNH